MNHANDNAPHPRSLRLEFSRAADYRRIDDLFDNKRDIDPHGYVVKRLDTHFRAAINTRGAAMLSDAQGNIMALTIAYRVRHIGAPANDNAHDVTELGSSLARLPGYNGAKLVVAALALREWWKHPARDAMIAEIKRDNIPSRRTYCDGLGWTELLDTAHTKRLYDATDVTLADDKDKGAGKNLSDLAHAKSLWHVCGDAAIRQSAKVLLEFMDQGGLVNKATGDKIAVDFNELVRAGLTRARLAAIAGGQLDRNALAAIDRPPPPIYF